MANRHKGTTRKSATKKPRKPTAKRPEKVNATGGDLLACVDRNACEQLVLQSLNALRTRKSRPDGRLCEAFHAIDLASQYEAACLYLLDACSLAEVRERLGERVGAVSVRVLERWISIVRAEYAGRFNGRLSAVETDGDLAAIKGDMAALSVALWGELTVKAAAYLRQMKFEELDNNTRNLYQRMAEGLTDQAKVQAEIDKTNAQTDKIRRQLVESVTKRPGGGPISRDDLMTMIDEALGLPSRAGAPA